MSPKDTSEWLKDKLTRVYHFTTRHFNKSCWVVGTWLSLWMHHLPFSFDLYNESGAKAQGQLWNLQAIQYQTLDTEPLAKSTLNHLRCLTSHCGVTVGQHLLMANLVFLEGVSVYECQSCLPKVKMYRQRIVDDSRECCCNQACSLNKLSPLSWRNTEKRGKGSTWPK